MIHFAKTTPPTIPRRPYILWLARALAGVIFAMFVVQLIKLPELVDESNAFVVWVILCGELLALPFLLNLPLSKAFRWVSWGMGWTMCFLGMPEPWPLLITIDFSLVFLLVSWGMWPSSRAHWTQKVLFITIAFVISYPVRTLFVLIALLLP